MSLKKTIIKAINLKHEYKDAEENSIALKEKDYALDGVNLEVEEGQFIAIVGHNGSGKSTLARHINALLWPTEGTITVDGKDSTNEEVIYDIRQTAGMIFQNPDNQIIATTVEEDVAFGPENLGIVTEEIVDRVDKALGQVDMNEHRFKSPNNLSGGQKQRVAIAGVLAMKPKCIIFDESTAMLDPHGREEVLNTAIRLNKEENVTVIFITHFMEEVVNADKIFVMEKGKVVMEGTPLEVFARPEELEGYGLSVPRATALAMALYDEGIAIRKNILSMDELYEELEKICYYK